MRYREFKSAILLAAALWCGGHYCYGQSEITWLGGTVYDFGRIREASGVVSHRFVFRNVGKKPFVVLGGAGRCGCTTATYTQGEIAPGDTASVVVRFDPAKRSGAFKQRVTVLLSGPSRHNTLFVKGEIEPCKDDSTIHINNHLKLEQ